MLYFNKLLLEISSDQLQIRSVSSKDLNDEKLLKEKLFIQRCVGVAWRPFWAFFDERRSCCNFSVHCLHICLKFLTFDKGPGLRTSTGQNWLLIITPPASNRKSALYDKHHPIYMKLKMCGLHAILCRPLYFYHAHVPRPHPPLMAFEPFKVESCVRCHCPQQRVLFSLVMVWPAKRASPTLLAALILLLLSFN